MINKKMLLLVPGVLLGVMAIAAEKTATADNAVPAKEVKPSSGVQAKVFENVGRQELLFRSNELVNAANKNINTCFIFIILLFFLKQVYFWVHRFQIFQPDGRRFRQRHQPL